MADIFNFPLLGSLNVSRSQFRLTMTKEIEATSGIDSEAFFQTCDGHFDDLEYLKAHLPIGKTELSGSSEHIQKAFDSLLSLYKKREIYLHGQLAESRYKLLTANRST